jgi:hypothetical protein
MPFIAKGRRKHRPYSSDNQILFFPRVARAQIFPALRFSISW